jgi:hypothetical protein
VAESCDMATKDSLLCPGVGSAESGMAADGDGRQAGRQAGRETEMIREVCPGTEAVAQQ